MQGQAAHPLLDGEVHLWRMPGEEDLLERFCADGWALLSPAERARHDSFSRPAAARRFLLGRVLLRHGLGLHLGQDPADLVLARGPHGKPILLHPAGHNLAFSLSHASAEILLVVAGMKRVGLDLEPRNRAATAHEIATRFFSLAEQRHLESAGEGAAAHALMLWTLKESVAKAMGRTVWDGLSDVRLAIEGERISWLAPPPEADACWILTAGRYREDYSLGLALEPHGGALGTELSFHQHILGRAAEEAACDFQPLSVMI